jgi:hypothetical protein
LDFLNWAESYTNAMDPLHEAPRVEEFEAEEYSWRADEEAKAEFSRLSGHDWIRSWKIAGAALSGFDAGDEDDRWREFDRDHHAVEVETAGLLTRHCVPTTTTVFCNLLNLERETRLELATPTLARPDDTK